jgi:NitT/TauT family transport system ATP-binding protein
MEIKLKNVNKSFDGRNDKEKLSVLDDVSFEMKPSEILCIVGPSGCGKSTIINLIAGFVFPDNGDISVDGKKIQGPSISRTVVFQDHAIFPWKTVKENVEFGLKSKNMQASERDIVVTELLKKVRLEKFADNYPDELSGGMKQRVALARAFAVKPEIILMDEPFASIDQQTRDILQEEFLRLQSEISQTVLFVTHNIEEALFLGDRIIVLSHRPAKIQEIFSVPFTKPRLPDIRNQPAFLELKHKIWHLLRERDKQPNLH